MICILFVIRKIALTLSLMMKIAQQLKKRIHIYTVYLKLLSCATL